MKKIIISSIAIGLALCFGIFALVMSLIPVGYNDIVEKPNEVWIYTSKTSEANLPNSRYTLRSMDENDVEKINRIYDLFNEGFKQNALSALFKGELKDKNEAKYVKSSNNIINKNKNSEDKFTVVFYYVDSLIIEANGKKDSYNYIAFEVDSTNERDLTVMAVTKNMSSDSMSTISYDYSFEAKINLNSLYNYLTDLVNVFD